MEKVSDVNANNWSEEVTKSTLLTVVYFWHDHCPWCQRLNPIFNEVSKEFKEKIRFLRMNVLEAPANKEIASDFGVMSTPTLLFLCKGRPVGHIVGFASKVELENGLNDILGRYRQCLSQSTELRPAYIV